MSTCPKPKPTRKFGGKRVASIESSKGEFSMVILHVASCPNGCTEFGPREARDLGVQMICAAERAETERIRS